MLLILAVGTIVQVTGCAGGSGASGLEATSAPDAGGEILFQDDFSDPNSGWDRYSNEDTTADYFSGGYHIFVGPENFSAWANPYRSFTDVRIDVDARKIGGNDDNEYGVLCRYQDEDNFYAATISSDGYYGLFGRLNGGDFQMIGMESMLPSEAIRQGEETNHIRLDCIGFTLSLYVNGELLRAVQDSSLPSGDVGLYAGTFGFPQTDVLFDQFVVYAP